MKMATVTLNGSINCPYCSHNAFDYPVQYREASNPWFFGKPLPERMEMTCKMCRGDSYVLASDMAVASKQIVER